MPLNSVPDMKISFCHFWTEARGLSGSIPLPVIGRHLQGTNYSVFYSYKNWTTEHFYLLRNVQLQLWLLEPIARPFSPIHVCQSEEQSASRAQPLVHTDIQDFKVTQTARKRPFPKTSKGEDAHRSLLLQMRVFSEAMRRYAAMRSFADRRMPRRGRVTYEASGAMSRL